MTIAPTSIWEGGVSIDMNMQPMRWPVVSPWSLAKASRSSDISLRRSARAPRRRFRKTTWNPEASEMVSFIRGWFKVLVHRHPLEWRIQCAHHLRERHDHRICNEVINARGGSGLSIEERRT